MPVHHTDCLVSVLYEDGHPVDISLAPRAETSMLGDVYVGKVEQIRESLGAAFVRIGEGGTAYLPLNRQERYLRTGARTEGPLCVGDELLVQVKREAMRGKLPRLSAEIELAGTWVVLTTEKIGRRFSSRLSDKERAALYARSQSLLAGCDFGAVFRTNAAEADEAELAREVGSLAAELNKILATGPTRTAGSCIFRDPGQIAAYLHSLPRHAEAEIVTDDAVCFAALQEHAAGEGGMPAEWTLRFYDDPLLPLSKLYDLRKLLADLSARRVWLKSGAYLVIEQTEAFVSIDVNTGKKESKRRAEEVFCQVNLEAAAEIARQLRLRQLSGTILIDFINLRSKEEERELLDAARSFFAGDPVRTTAVDITALGIMEVTRQKVRRSLAEEIAFLKEMEVDDE